MFAFFQHRSKEEGMSLKVVLNEANSIKNALLDEARAVKWEPSFKQDAAFVPEADFLFSAAPAAMEPAAQDAAAATEETPPTLETPPTVPQP